MTPQKHVMCIILCLTSLFARSQDVNSLIASGRAFLAQRNLTNANVSFKAALELSPEDETANALRALTRILVIPNQSPISEFLDRLGVSRTNRNIYDWNTTFPKDTNGVPLAPPGMSAAEASELIRTNVLREIGAAAENLARIVGPGFLLNLSSNETTIGAQTVDRGDILLLRSLLHLTEYVGYTVSAWNFDAQLSALRVLYTSKSASIEKLLLEYPDLFTFSTTNDLERARNAFEKAATLYPEASAFIRSRPTNLVRLFNYDPEMDESETSFRTTLSELNESLSGPMVLSLDTNLTMQLRSQFANPVSARELLPDFSTNLIIAGTLPDSTFGGIVQGVEPWEFERFLGRDRYVLSQDFPGFRFVSRLTTPSRLPDGRLRLRINALEGSFFVIQYSTDLRIWNDLTTGTAQGGFIEFGDPDHIARRFYRALDRSDAIRFEGSVLEVPGERPISDALVTISFSQDSNNAPRILAGISRTTESGYFVVFGVPESTYLWATLSVFSPGLPIFEYQTWVWKPGSHFVAPVYLAPETYRPQNDSFFSRLPILETNLAVTGFTVGATRESSEPYLGNGKTIWWSWTAPADGAVILDTAASAPEPSVAVYTGNSLQSLKRVWASYQQGAFFVTGGIKYEIQADAGGLAGKVSLRVNWAAPEAPKITRQPQSQISKKGSYASFYTSATGTNPLQFQWQKNEIPILNETNSYFFLQSVSLDDAGEYSLIISNRAGSTVSSKATLTVE